MKKFMVTLGFLGKMALGMIMPLCTAISAYLLFMGNVNWTREVIVLLWLSLFFSFMLGVASLMLLPKHKIKINLVPALGVFLGIDPSDGSIQVLFLCLHIEVLNMTGGRSNVTNY
jgi:hypothetical protein